MTDLAKREPIREAIGQLETVMKSMAQAEVSITHHFSKDVYAREMFLPKGVLVVGKIHKHQNLNIISSGKVRVLSIDGLFVLSAPHTFVASPGAKRVIYALEDTVWTTIHGTKEQDVDKIEDEFIAKTYGDVVEISSQEFDLLKGA